MPQSVKHLTLAQVMILQFVGSSPTSGYVLTAQSLEPALDSLSPSLSVPLSLSLKNKQTFKKRLEIQNIRGPLGGSVIKCLTLDLSSGLDLRVVSSSPMLGSMLSMEPT